jgi:hypothetical protein
MIFSWFKKKSANPLGDLIKQDSAAFVRSIRAMVEQSEPASNAMCLVALANLPVMLSVLNQQIEKQAGASVDLDTHIQSLLASGQAGDEISQRRCDWFFLGMLIYRSSHLGQKSPTLADDVAAIWICLAESAQFLPALLSHNIVWEPLEKEWFAPIKSKQDAAGYVLSWMLPKWLKSHPAVLSYAQDMNLWAFRDTFIPRPVP